MLVRIVGALLLAAADPGLAAEWDQAGDPAVSGTFSASRRFYVTGGSPGETVYFSTWAEEVTDKLSGLTGEYLVLRRDEFIHIAVRSDPERGLAHIATEQGFVDLRFRQKLVIADPASVDQEEALAGLCRLLLTRCMISRHRWTGSRERLPHVPDWLVAGIAQQLYPEVRIRNIEYAQEAWRESEGLTLREVMAHEDDDEDAKRALSAAAVDWVTAEAVVDDPWGRILDRLAEGQSVDVEWLADHILGLDSVVELNKRWDLWFASRNLVERRWGSYSLDDVRHLERLLVVPAAVLSLARSTVVGEPLSLGDLVKYRGEEWMPSVVTYLNLRIRGAGIGRSAEFVAVCDAYGRFLEGLLAPEPGGRWARWLGRGVQEAELMTMLNEANVALSRLRDRASPAL